MAHDISAETRRRIEEGLRDWDDPSSPARKRYEAFRPEYDARFKRLVAAIEESECITADDLNTMIY